MSPLQPPTLPSPVIKLLLTILTNASKPEQKYKSINLEGNAGKKLQNEKEAMEILSASGWIVEGTHLVFPAVSRGGGEGGGGEMLRDFG